MQAATMPVARHFSFCGGNDGPWIVSAGHALAGEPIVVPARLRVMTGADIAAPAGASWMLRGVTSNERYVERAEKAALVAVQEGLGRPASTCAALIPIRKNPAWWALTQDERRAIFEAQSNHIAIGMKYLPAIARRLHHCRDLASNEPFDFLTWFEFAPADAHAFDDLLGALRASPEWEYVDREMDIRLVADFV